MRSRRREHHSGPRVRTALVGSIASESRPGRLLGYPTPKLQPLGVTGVIYNSGAYLGSGVRPPGIITAYAPGPIIAAQQTTHPRPAGYARVTTACNRADCLVYQGI